jgi:secondary thiamine-phosphate synthase enzyme
MIHGTTVKLATEGFSDVHDVTGAVRDAVRASGIDAGLVHVFAVGSTASVTTIEYEPALVRDMEEALEKLWPRTMRSHHSETWGDDNGFSHLRAAFLGPSLTVPVHDGELVLGTWQQVVVVCHDNRPRERKVFVQVVGE